MHIENQMQDFYRRLAQAVVTNAHEFETLAPKFGLTTGELMRACADERLFPEIEKACRELLEFVSSRVDLNLDVTDPDYTQKLLAAWRRIPKFDRDPPGWSLP